jgi:hypothetical protein
MNTTLLAPVGAMTATFAARRSPRRASAPRGGDDIGHHDGWAVYRPRCQDAGPVGAGMGAKVMHRPM